MRLIEFRNSRPSDIGSGISHKEYKGLINNIKKRMLAGQPKGTAIKNEIMANWKSKKIDIHKLTTKLDLDVDIV